MDSNIGTTFVFDKTVDSDRGADIEHRLRTYNEQRSRQWEANHDDSYSPSPLQIFVFDDSRDLIGGVLARTHALRDWLEVQVIWIDEVHRGLGLGKKLIAEAEDEGRRRGCKYARLSSSDYQAPGFYERIGYSLYGRLENCPPGDTVFYFCKNLSEESAASLS